jgi:hypothetical protein
MIEALHAEYLRLRRQELATAVAGDTEQAAIKTRDAEQHQRNAERNRIRIEELDYLLAGLEKAAVSEKGAIGFHTALTGPKRSRTPVARRSESALPRTRSVASGTPDRSS